MAITLKDVAERAGVSRSAVVAHLHAGGLGLGQDPRQGGKGRAGTGLQPQRAGLVADDRAHQAHRSGVQQLPQPAVPGGCSDLFTRGLQDRGLRPLLVNLSDETDPANSVHMLRQYSVDGVIVASSTLPAQLCRGLPKRGRARRSFLRALHDRALRACRGGIDNIACGRMAAEGAGRPGLQPRGRFSAGPEKATSTQDRALGFFSGAGRTPRGHGHRQLCQRLFLRCRPGRDDQAADAGPGRGLFLRRRTCCPSARSARCRRRA